MRPKKTLLGEARGTLMSCNLSFRLIIINCMSSKFKDLFVCFVPALRAPWQAVLVLLHHNKLLFTSRAVSNFLFLEITKNWNVNVSLGVILWR